MVLGKVYENSMKIYEKCNFTKPILKKVISIRNLLSGPKIDNNEIWAKKQVSMDSATVYENCPKINEKWYFTKLTSKIGISTKNTLFGHKIR